MESHVYYTTKDFLYNLGVRVAAMNSLKKLLLCQNLILIFAVPMVETVYKIVRSVGWITSTMQEDFIII